MPAKAKYHNHNTYTLHYSPKLTDFLLADSNVHAITPQNSSPNTSHHSQEAHQIRDGSSQTGYCGQKLEYFLCQVEDKIKKGVQNFVLSLPASEKMSIKLEQSIEALLLNMLNISKQIKLFRHHSQEHFSHQISPLAASHPKYEHPQSHMLIQQGNDLPILSEYPSYEQYEQESKSINSNSSGTFVLKNKTGRNNGYQGIHRHKWQVKKSVNHLLHRHYADNSGSDSDNLQEQELSMSDKQTESEIGTEDHPETTSVLPKSYARSSEYHTSSSKYTPRQLFTQEQNLGKQNNCQQQAKLQESISEYYLESSYGSKIDKENERPSININEFHPDMRGPTVQSKTPQTYLYSQVLSRKKIF